MRLSKPSPSKPVRGPGVSRGGLSRKRPLSCPCPSLLALFSHLSLSADNPYHRLSMEAYYEARNCATRSLGVQGTVHGDGRVSERQWAPGVVGLRLAGRLDVAGFG